MASKVGAPTTNTTLTKQQVFARGSHQGHRVGGYVDKLGGSSEVYDCMDDNTLFTDSTS